MYTDYPTIYETNLNQNLIYLFILGAVVLIILIVLMISLFKVFKKANRSGILSIVPIYNIIVLLEIVNRASWQIILFFIPIVNFVFYYKIAMNLAESFRKSRGFGFGLFFLPIIFLPILAFSSSEYIGINLIAMAGIDTVEETLDSEIDKNVPTINDERDVASSKIGISIGGGVYQSDYNKSLLNVDTSQAVTKKAVIQKDAATVDSLLGVGFSSSKNTFIKDIEIPDNKEDTSLIDSISELESVKEQVIQIPVYQEGVESSNTINDLSSQSAMVSKTSENEEYINCSNCGARVRSGAGSCFLCGRHLS